MATEPVDRKASSFAITQFLNAALSHLIRAFPA